MNASHSIHGMLGIVLHMYLKGPGLHHMFELHSGAEEEKAAGPEKQLH